MRDRKFNGTHIVMLPEPPLYKLMFKMCPATEKELLRNKWGAPY
jgi:hypothetical protein